MRKKILTAITISLIALTMVACGSSDTQSNNTTSNVTSGSSDSTNTEQNTQTTAKTTLTLGCGNFSDSLDPSANANSGWATARYGIGEPLFQFDSSMNAIPNLCDTYEVDETKTIWSFHIRDGVTFSNGKELTATAVKENFDYLYYQEANNLGTNKPSQYFAVDTIEADDETNVVTITTAKPYADATKILSHVNYIILDVESDLSTSPVGTGPYKVVSNNVGVSLSLAKNENYWNGDVPFENLEIVYIEDSTTKSLALQAGDIDLVDSITTSHDLDTLRDSSEFNVTETLSARTAFSYINNDGIMGNDTLREAVLLAIDDETICEITVGGVYTAGHSILPFTLDYGYDTLTDATPYNLELAKTMLDEAGIVDTDGDGIRELDGENINLTYISYVLKSLDAVSEGVTMCLSDLGIGVDLRILDSDTHWNMVVNSAFDLAICSWITTPVGDPIGFLENWYSEGSMNYGNYYSEEFDSLYAELLVEIDTDKQKEIIERIQQILIDDAAIMVHGYYESNLSSNNKITGVELPMAETYWITTNIKPAN